MAKKQETIFSNRLCKVLESQCAFIINVHGHMMQKAGISDLQVIHRRWKGFLELKMNKNKPSDLQVKFAKKVITRGVPCYVFRCVETLTYGGAKSSDPWTYPDYIYQLEDFYGKIIAKVNRLNRLIDILAELESKVCDEN